MHELDPSRLAIPRRPRSGSGLRFVLLTVALVSSAGCYTFIPTTPGDVVPDQDVRLRVTGAFADSLGPLIQRPDARVVEGRAVATGPGSLTFEIPVGAPDVGTRGEPLRQRIQIPEGALLNVEVKTLSRPRTGVAAAAAIGGAVGLVIWQFGGDSGGAPMPGPGRPPEDIVTRPVLGVSWDLVRALFGR